MATAAVPRHKKSSPKKDLARELPAEIGRKVEKLPEKERKSLHSKLLGDR